MRWIDAKTELPPHGEEVLVWIDGHRGPSWGNNYALVAYMTRAGDWFEERHRMAEALVGVTHWARIERPNG